MVASTCKRIRTNLKCVYVLGPFTLIFIQAMEKAMFVIAHCEWTLVVAMFWKTEPNEGNFLCVCHCGDALNSSLK